jgi:hypothetical protein
VFPERRISTQLLSLETDPDLALQRRPFQEKVLGAHVLSWTSAGVVDFLYVAFIPCMGKHSSGIGFSYVRFLFLLFFFLSVPYVSLAMSPF